jgi:hypothetical protein
MSSRSGFLPVILAIFLASSAASADEPRAINDDAKQHFRAGVALLQDPEGERVEEAYREFRAAFDASGSPKILGNLGFCAMRLERDGEAIEYYSRYLREVQDIDPDERAQIVRDLQTLSVGVVRITIEVNKPGAIILDERVPVRGMRVTNSYGPLTATTATTATKLEIGVRPGHHIFTARLAGYNDATWEVEAYAGSRDKYAFTLKETPRPVSPHAAKESGPGIGPWITIGTGGALLVAGAVTGFVALGKTNDISDRCPNDVCPRSYTDLDSDRSSAKTFVRLTDAFLVSGAAVTLAGVGWLIIGTVTAEPKKKGSLPPPITASLPGAACGPTGCFATWKAAF